MPRLFKHFPKKYHDEGVYHFIVLPKAIGYRLSMLEGSIGSTLSVEYYGWIENNIKMLIVQGFHTFFNDLVN